MMTVFQVRSGNIPLAYPMSASNCVAPLFLSSDVCRNIGGMSQVTYHITEQALLTGGSDGNTSDNESLPAITCKKYIRSEIAIY